MSLNKKELGSEAHFQTKEEIRYSSVLAAFSDFKGGFRGSTETVYKAFKVLSEEFSDKFPSLYFSDLGRMPYSRELEDDLSDLGHSGILEHVCTTKEDLLVSARNSRAIQKTLKQMYGENVLKDSLPIAKRFKELVKELKKAKVNDNANY